MSVLFFNFYRIENEHCNDDASIFINALKNRILHIQLSFYFVISKFFPFFA